MTKKRSQDRSPSRPLHSGRTKYERSLILRFQWIKTELLRLKVHMCDADADKIDEVMSVVDLQVVGPWNIDYAERRFRELYPEFAVRASDDVQEIALDCPPGDPRPEDLIEAVIEGTGLPAREAESPFMGDWTWNYSDMPADVWAKAKPALRRRIFKLYREGKIRYGKPAFGE
jgi:hypothetical protein